MSKDKREFNLKMIQISDFADFCQDEFEGKDFDAVESMLDEMYQLVIGAKEINNKYFE